MISKNVKEYRHEYFELEYKKNYLENKPPFQYFIISLVNSNL